MDTVIELKRQIKLIQQSCSHLPKYVTIKYKRKAYDVWDVYLEQLMRSTFRCNECDKSWIELGTITHDEYSERF